jgi:6-pyruvoyltetrahydropterin/6-carboxytetrahydropterin synthase
MSVLEHAVTVRHNFETAHRLPHLHGKCGNLHGHSWWAEVTVAAPDLSAAWTVVEFGAFKTRMRNWIDTRLDHGAMLGAQDPLANVLIDTGSKVFVFGADWEGSPWPTVESVAHMLGVQAAEWLAAAGTLEATPTPPAPGVRVAQVRVTETAVNAATWTPGEGQARR